MKAAEIILKYILSPITNYPLPITHYQLPITHYQLPNLLNNDFIRHNSS
ncbi:hypothetical protein [Dolichospermum circinale]|nr:hypothetical protein [Dolichospermum circinale]MDB9452935.1 hypothetical protein [Dolichospermum circinale CS-541/06]MDB9461948.1 hypothetical protein [Dolichospermum circinale CS-541/04]MDB9546825.1 hypothetical protein [Dolichospermum circinale CS-1031]